MLAAMSHNPPLLESNCSTLISEAEHMAKALADLGCRDDTLNSAQQHQLDSQGYLLLEQHMDNQLLERLRTVHDRLMTQKYGTPMALVEQSVSDFWYHERGTRRLTELTSTDPVFDSMHSDPVILAAVARIFAGPFKLDAINAREALPGNGHQNLHRDNYRTSNGKEPGVNTAWLLDDFSTQSGATRIVPGSHLWQEGPESMADSSQPHPQELLVQAPAGSVMIFCNTLWHGGTQNRSNRGRRVVHVSYRRREVDLGERAQRLHIRKCTWDRLSPAARWILEV
jgi:ectoine hydroxylase-related dioxygenase (phytanoyl-CoA dioxygenase family)